MVAWTLLVQMPYIQDVLSDKDAHENTSARAARIDEAAGGAGQNAERVLMDDGDESSDDDPERPLFAAEVSDRRRARLARARVVLSLALSLSLSSPRAARPAHELTLFTVVQAWMVPVIAETEGEGAPLSTAAASNGKDVPSSAAALRRPTSSRDFGETGSGDGANAAPEDSCGEEQDGASADGSAPTGWFSAQSAATTAGTAAGGPLPPPAGRTAETMLSRAARAPPLPSKSRRGSGCMGIGMGENNLQPLTLAQREVRLAAGLRARWWRYACSHDFCASPLPNRKSQRRCTLAVSRSSSRCSAQSSRRLSLRTPTRQAASTSSRFAGPLQPLHPQNVSNR